MATQRKNTVELNIQTKILDKSQLENYKNTLSDMLKDTAKYNVNAKTIKATLSTINEILSSLPKDGKVNLQQVTKLKNLFKDLGEETTKIGTQLSLVNNAKDIKEINKALVEQRNILEQQEKALKKQQALKEKNKVLSEAQFAIRQDKKATNRSSADTKADKLLKQAEEKKMSVEDYGKKNGFSEEEIKKANEMQKSYSKAYQEYLKDQGAIIDNIDAEIKEINNKINQAKSNIESLEKQHSIAMSGGPSEDVSAASSTTAGVSQEARNSQNALESLTEKMKKTGQTTAKLTTQNGGLESSFGRTTKAVIKYGFVYKTVISAIREAIKTITQLDQALTDMGMLTGKSREELHKLIPTFAELAKNTSSTITEVAELTTEYMKQGRTLKDSIELSEQTAKAARIAGISVSESLEYMTSAINGFNLAATDAERVSDIFAKVGAATATDYEELAVALSKVSAQANTAGLSIEFTTSLLAKGIETTQEAPESIGTALKTVLARMRELSDYGASLEDNTSINKVERALGAVGVKLRDTNGQFRDMEEIFKELGPQWNTLNGMQQQAIAQAVAGTRQQSRFLAIMQDWDRTLEISQIAEESAGATRYQYSKQSEGLAATLTRLTTAWQNFVQQFADNDLLIKGAETIENIFNKVNGFLEFLNKDGGNFGSAATIIGVLVLAKGLLDKILEPIRNVLNSVQEAAGAVNQIAGAQNAVNQELQEELTLREKIFGAIDKSNQEVEKSKKLEKSLFGIATKGLRDKVKQNNKLKKQAKEELGLAGKLSKTEKKQLKEKKNQLKEELKIEKAEKKKANSRKENIAKAQQEYDIAKQERSEAEKGLETAKENKKVLEERKNKLLEEQSINQQNLDDSENIHDYDDLRVQQQTIKNELSQVDKELQTATTAETQAQANFEAAENNQKTKSIALSQAQENKERNIVVQKLQQFAFGIGTALTNFATMALAGIAIAAVTSLIGSIGGNISGATARKNIGESQEKIYENKEKKNTITSLRDEYKELYLKKAAGTLDQEGADRMQEIADALAEQDPSITGDNILEASQAVIDKLDEDNKKLIKSMQTDYEKVNKKRKKDDNKEWLKSDEGISAFQDLAQDAMKSAGYKSESSDQMLTQLTNSLDYEDIVEKGTDMVELYKEVAKVAGSYAKAMDGADGNLELEIKAYKDALKLIEDDNIKDAFKQNNVGLGVLAEHSQTVSALIDKEMNSDSIKNFSDSMIALGFSVEGVGKALQELSGYALKTSDELTAAYHDMLRNSLTYTEQDWANRIEGYNELDEAGKKAAKVKYQDQLKLLATGMDLSQTGDKIKNLSSTKNTSRDIASKLISGEKLDLEDYDTLEELGLMSDKTFVDMLTSSPAKAAMKILENLNDSTADLEKKIVDTIEGERITLERDQKEFNELNSKIWDSSKNEFRAGVSEQDINRWNELNNSIKISNSLINTSNAQLESLKNTVIKIDETAINISKTNRKISNLQKKIDKGGATHEDYQDLLSEYDNLEKMYKSKLDDEWQRLADTVGLTAKEVKNCFEYTEDGFVPASKEAIDKMIGLGKLTADEANWLLENLEIVNETNASLEKTVDLKEEANQAMIDDALEAQDYFIEMYKSKLEKENEALQESLDKRAEAYEKYFDSLEDKEESADYETERQKLINRIASLSTATDSASLTKLKEAQQELADLNKDRATSQRELRREAVAERFEEQKEAAEKKLEETLADGNKLLEELINGLKSGDLSLWSLGADSGTFEGMTTLGMMSWFKEAGGMMSTFNSFDFASMLGSALSPSITGVEGITNNSSSASIVNNINLADKLNDPVQKEAFNKQITDFFNDLLIQWGLNPNTNAY